MKPTPPGSPCDLLEENEDYPTPRALPSAKERKRARRDLRQWANAWDSWMHGLVSHYARHSSEAEFPLVIDSLVSWGDALEREACLLLKALQESRTRIDREVDEEGGGVISETTKPPPPPFGKPRD